MARKTKEDAERTRQQIIDAARRIFHQCGVSRTSLEKIAVAAGVTRGAVYWHFADKAALFFAMLHASSTVTIARADEFLLPERYADPLDAIEHSILSFFDTLNNCTEIRETFEIMSLRCEYVDEFAPVLDEVNKPAHDFLVKLKQAYQRAANAGKLRPGLDPEAMAFDSVSFVSGLYNNWIAARPGDAFRENAARMIRAHIELRRVPAYQSGAAGTA